MFADFVAFTSPTPISSPVYNWAEYRPSALESHSVGYRPTSFVSRPVVDLLSSDHELATPFGGDGDAGLKPILKETVTAVGSRFEARSHNHIEDVAAQRVQLMAAKYVDDKPSQEVLARLAILDERLLALSPRVTSEHVAALEGFADQLRTAEERRVDRARRFGI